MTTETQDETDVTCPRCDGDGCDPDPWSGGRSGMAPDPCWMCAAQGRIAVTMFDLLDAHPMQRVNRLSTELERAADVWAWMEREQVSLMPVLGGSGAFVGWSCGHPLVGKRIIRRTPWEAVQATRALAGGAP